jgi:hypothetical protein
MRQPISPSKEECIACHQHPDSRAEKRTIELPTGVLDLEVKESEIPLDDLLGFAARHNPKRGFLYVSKVLGKHVAQLPSVIRAVHTKLASRIPLNLPGPVLFVAMAETAICLGHGVFDEYVRISGRDDLLFVHSTRYRLSRAPAVEFLEEHCHAPDHFIYEPDRADLKRTFFGARTLVLVDDEASTGKTMVNLVGKMKTILPFLEQVVTAVITDWRGAEKTEKTHAALPVPAYDISILKGRYNFSPAKDLSSLKMPDVTGDGQCKDEILPFNYGRLCLSSRCDSVYCQVQRLSQTLLERLNFSTGVEESTGKILVTGTGEFAYPPFLLAEMLESLGVNVRYQSTTRSPIMIGLSIANGIEHRDNYGDGIANFLYNAHPENYDAVLVCHETPTDTLDASLISALSALSVDFGQA